MYSWNPWRGCHKLSAGCENCYIHRADKRRNRDTTIIQRLEKFNQPIRKNKNGEYTFKSGNIVATCFSSDFFIEEADEWRPEAWKIIRERKDLLFFFITKRIDRFYVGFPNDWEDGYNNIIIATTVENQDRADYRLPIFRDLPIKHKMIACEPLLEQIDLSPYIGSWVEQIATGGEVGGEARPCNYDWILDIRRQCIEFDIPFLFRQTGGKFIKNGKLFKISYGQAYSQARKAGINYKIQSPLYTKAGEKESLKKYLNS